MAADYMKAAIRSMESGPMRTSLGGLNPTGAAVIRTNNFGEEIREGKCNRQVWYSKNGIPRTNPMNDTTFVRFEVGNAMEDALQSHWRRQGLLIDGNIKMKGNINTEEDPVIISGEVDAILRQCETDANGNPTEISTTKAVGIEVKTTRGYGARKTLGDKEYSNGAPRLSYVLQTAVYLKMKDRLEDYYGVEITHFEIWYVMVDTCMTKGFKVWLEDEDSGRVMVSDMDGNIIKSGAGYCMDMSSTTGENYQSLGDFTIEDVIDQYKIQRDVIELDAPPPRDFKIRHSDEELERMWKRGQIAKTNWAKIEKGSRIMTCVDVNGAGNWECNFCDWRNECYPLGALTEMVEAGELTTEEAMEELGF